MNNLNYQHYQEILNYGNDEQEYRRYKKYYQKNYLCFLPNNKNAKILDIGCGNGYFLRMCKEYGYNNLYGIDLVEDNVSLCKGYGLQVENISIQDFLKANHMLFDSIIMNDVIEHIPRSEIIDLLVQLKTIMVSGGTMLIKTMNMSNPVAVNTLFCDFTHEWGSVHSFHGG